MVAAPSLAESTSLLYRDVKSAPGPDLVVGAKGVYLELADGRKILDACAGAAVASVGHGDQRVVQAIANQLSTLSYHHTSRLTNPTAEALAKELVGHKPGGLTYATFYCSGSEANESALKLARQYWLEIGEPERCHFISRHNSYHGNTLGAVSLTGIPGRRAPFEPMLMSVTSQVSPCYPYRYKRDGETDEAYVQRLADELEGEIIRIGPKKVAAFWAETVGGASGGNLTAVPGYFIAIRRVCDKYGVLLILDEVMSGMGRTGKLHAWEWEGVSPDIQTIAKGLSGGYQPVSGVLLHEKIHSALKKGTGKFTNGHTFQCHPAGSAAALAVLGIFKTDKVVENCAARGEELYKGLYEALKDHPNVGEIRGRGLFRSIEFVMDKQTKATFPLDLPLAALLDNAIFDRGVAIYSGFAKGTADGIRGDHILLSPPLTISAEEVKIVVKGVVGGIEEVFAMEAVVRALAGGKK